MDTPDGSDRNGLGALYGSGARELQDHFDSRRLADRLASLTLHDALDEGDIALVRDQSTVWVATVDADGGPDVFYKGGAPGFVEVVDPSELRMPIYNGNGMWRTLGNCGRYIHRDGKVSPYVPAEGHEPPVPDWKRLPPLREVLPANDPARDG